MSSGLLAVLAVIALGAGRPAGRGIAPAPVVAEPQAAYGLEARVWIHEGDEPVLRRGARTRVYYRVSDDAYIAVFHIDTDGFVRLLYPRSPDDDDFAWGGRLYRLLLGDSPYWTVDDRPGVGYFFIVASPEPLDFAGFHYSVYDAAWDLGAGRSRVHGDPYVAMEDFVAYLLPEWRTVDYALDFAAYHVERTYSYPRFLCYDCHGFRPYDVWNPYYQSCIRFRVVIYDDPYYYPVYRYRGTRVVYVRPPASRQPRFVFKERAEGEAGSPLIRSRARSEGGGAPEVARRPAGGVDAPRPAAPTGVAPEARSGARPGERASEPRTPGVPRAQPPAAAQGGRGVERGTRPGLRLPGRALQEPRRGTERPGDPPGPERRNEGAVPRLTPQVPPASRQEPQTPRERPTLERRPPAQESRPARTEPQTRDQPPGAGGGGAASRPQPSQQPPPERSAPPVRESRPPPVKESRPPPVKESRPPPVQQSRPPPVKESRPPPVQQSRPPPVRESRPPPVRESSPAAVRGSGARPASSWSGPGVSRGRARSAELKTAPAAAPTSASW